MSGDATPWPAPAANPWLVGHLRAENRMRAALDAGRLHHAWLISGPEGVGKATLAFRFARHLLARGEAPPEPGGDLALPEDHPVFRRIAAGAHPDLMHVERRPDPRTGRPRQAIGVEEARKVLHFLSLTPAEGGWRVVIIDPVDELNAAAANALLKTLEEPPARALFLLVSHAPGRLLPTIRSRCLHLPLRPLDAARVRECLALLLPEGAGVSPERLETVARHAAGAPGRALALATGRAGEMFAGLTDMLAAGGGVDGARLDAMARELAPASELADYRLFTAVLRDWMQAQAAHAARHGHVRLARRWAELEEETARRLARSEALNLDRGLTLRGVLSRLAELAATTPAAVASLA